MIRFVRTPRASLARLILPVVPLLFFTNPSLAGPLADAAASAETKAQAGDALGAYDTMRQALADFSSTLPLTVGKAVFVSEVPSAYGIYAERKDTNFKPGEPLITYLELIGLTWKPATDAGKQETSFTVDFELVNSKSEVLASQKTFGNFNFTGFYRNQEIFTHLKLELTGAAIGDYVLRYTVSDTNSGRSTKLEQPFAIIAP
ncbi:hypothetical protein MRS76_24525 [Rhizobiaceae bacterium n13]|uniref:Uncharacterized protein n=1 Tax=Ferirhizobium litorale TaxID=2927786 RepID=A0AAE3U2N9_9HYPH|nr:hypothetical protein [Fererhizobium litorale]MDI7865085.1 hypothetical protein [Fererhizobium litorale]MDI7922902.1 hypothetical protein [Fererhizobium litorale]